MNDVATIDKQHRKARSSQGINVMMVYTEDENSKVVDGHVALEIQTYAQSVWVHMANIYGAPSALRSGPQNHEKLMDRTGPDHGSVPTFQKQQRSSPVLWFFAGLNQFFAKRLVLVCCFDRN